MAEDVLAMTISLTPDQIRDLARQINETIRGLTDIDAILEATKEDLDKAQRLKERADNARYLFGDQWTVWTRKYWRISLLRIVPQNNCHLFFC